MNRRTFLRAAGVSVSLPSLALAGCLSELRLDTPVPLYVENETDRNYNLEITARSLEDGRRRYEQEITAPPDQTASVEHLSNSDQRLRVVLFDGGDQLDIAEANVRERTQSITITITEDGLRIDSSERERSEEAADDG